MNKISLSFFAACALTLASCSTPKNITYLPDLASGSIVQAENVFDIKVRPGDRLSILVSTQDQNLSNLFNLVYAQTRVGVNSTMSNSEIAAYTVDSKGDIAFPIIGKIHVAGLNREQIAAKIADDLVKADLIKDPIVSVNYANTGVAVLGEVARPGRYEFNRDHLTIIDAIAMAGDLTLQGVRDNILVMRDLGDGRKQAYRVNLLDAKELSSSPVFYLQQDDMIYVEPNDKRKRETTASGNTPYTPSFWITVGSLGVTIATLITTLAK